MQLLMYSMYNFSYTAHSIALKIQFLHTHLHNYLLLAYIIAFHESILIFFRNKSTFMYTYKILSIIANSFSVSLNKLNRILLFFHFFLTIIHSRCECIIHFFLPWSFLTFTLPPLRTSFAAFAFHAASAPRSSPSCSDKFA